MIACNRRQFLCASAAAATAAAAGLPLSDDLRALTAVPQEPMRWDRGVCRFCGTGCGIEIASQGNRIVAIKGDPASPVNRGLLCVKGYANAKILYGARSLATLACVADAHATAIGWRATGGLGFGEQRCSSRGDE